MRPDRTPSWCLADRAHRGGIQECQARVHRQFVGRVVHAKTRSHADGFPHSEDSRAHGTALFLAAPFSASTALTLLSTALQKVATRAVNGWVLSATRSLVPTTANSSPSSPTEGCSPGCNGNRRR